MAGRSREATCRDCGLPIQFVRTTSGTMRPLDISHDKAGRWSIGPGRVAVELSGVALEQAHAEGQLLFTQHFETCPRSPHRPPASGRMPPHVRAQLQQRSHGSPARRARG